MRLLDTRWVMTVPKGQCGNQTYGFRDAASRLASAL